MQYKEIQCFECNGKGETEGTLPECSTPASACCGGCYVTYTCNICEGSGKLYTEDEDIIDLMLMIEAYEKMTIGYKKTLKDFKDMIKGVSEDGLLEMGLLLDHTHKIQLDLINDQLNRIDKHTEILQKEIRKEYE